MVGMNSGYIASLPAPVKRRLKALKRIQLESTKIEAMQCHPAWRSKALCAALQG